MDFGSDITDNKKVVVTSQSYDNHIRRIRRCLAHPWTITSVTGSATSGKYYQLQDGGRPQAIVQANGTNLTVVNTPVYLFAPPTIVTGVALGGGGNVTFTLTSISC